MRVGLKSLFVLGGTFLLIHANSVSALTAPRKDLNLNTSSTSTTTVDYQPGILGMQCNLRGSGSFENEEVNLFPSSNTGNTAFQATTKAYCTSSDCSDQAVPVLIFGSGVLSGYTVYVRAMFDYLSAQEHRQCFLEWTVKDPLGNQVGLGSFGGISFSQNVPPNKFGCPVKVPNVDVANLNSSGQMFSSAQVTDQVVDCDIAIAIPTPIVRVSGPNAY